MDTGLPPLGEPSPPILQAAEISGLQIATTETSTPTAVAKDGDRRPGQDDGSEVLSRPTPRRQLAVHDLNRICSAFSAAPVDESAGGDPVDAVIGRLRERIAKITMGESRTRVAALASWERAERDLLKERRLAEEARADSERERRRWSEQRDELLREVARRDESVRIVSSNLSSAEDEIRRLFSEKTRLEAQVEYMERRCQAENDSQKASVQVTIDRMENEAKIREAHLQDKIDHLQRERQQHVLEGLEYRKAIKRLQMDLYDAQRRAALQAQIFQGPSDAEQASNARELDNLDRQIADLTAELYPNRKTATATAPRSKRR
ncbi:Uncharacterized protein PBTT_03064 [Plasmodiophora brassicae]|nr:hypothetical protein PBRA_003016 [Plasmodiophora brassicae]